MSIFVIWIDQEQAKLFQFSHDKMERKYWQAGHQVNQKKQEQALFSEISGHLSQALRILILGPGVAKNHFKDYLIKHLPAVNKKVVKCETVDHPTDSQIAALVQKFFKMPVSVSSK